MDVFEKLMVHNEQLVIQQWQELSSFEIEAYCNVKEVNVQEFWSIVYQIEDNGRFSFRDLGSIFLDAQAIPHANAGVERRFSDAKNTKTYKRNCINIDTLDGLLRARDIVKSFSKNGVFTPPEDMIDFYLEENYEKKRKSRNRKNLLNKF